MVFGAIRAGTGARERGGARRAVRDLERSASAKDAEVFGGRSPEDLAIEGGSYDRSVPSTTLNFRQRNSYHGLHRGRMRGHMSDLSQITESFAAKAEVVQARGEIEPIALAKPRCLGQGVSVGLEPSA